MRVLPGDISNKISQKIQTKANNSEPNSSIWVSRPVVPLTNDKFLEKQTVSTETVTDASIAVCHPRMGSESTKIYIAYISGGKAKVASSMSKVKMSAHVWVDTGFSEDAVKVSIAFNGKMPKDDFGQIEFVTELMPWIFWATSDGHCYGQKLGDPSSKVTLSETNCTNISAVRASWSEVPRFDFGLCLFSILNGAVYVRQYIDGVWYDAEPVPTAALPTLEPGVTWVQIAASRTWDYRIVLQLVDSNNVIYEVFTQYGGIGSRNVEHLRINRITARGTLTQVHYTNTAETEHLEISSITAGALYGGLYSISTPVLKSACNYDDGSGDYGKRAMFVFDVHLNPTEVAAQASCFVIEGENGVDYPAATATLGTDGKTVNLIFADFNNAGETATAKYVPGTVTTMAGNAMATTSIDFNPTGLVPVNIPVPEVASISNI